MDEALGSVGKELKKTKSASMLLYKPVVHPCPTAARGEGVPSDESVLAVEELPRMEQQSKLGLLAAEAMADSKLDRPAG